MKTIAKFLMLSSLMLLSAVKAQTAPADTLQRIKEEKKIRISHRESSVPFSYVIADSKRPVGYAVDICLQSVEAIKRHLGLTDLAIEWVPVNAKQRFEFLDTGKIDMECGSTTNNPERRLKYAFSVPYFIASLRFLAREDSKIKSIEHLISRTVAASKGTTGLKLLQQLNENRVLNLTIVETDTDQDGVAQLREKKVDAVFNDDILLSGYRAAEAKPEDFVVEGELLSVEPYAVMMRKDPKFNNVVNQELIRMALSKEIEALYTKWFLQEIPPKKLKLALPMGHLLRDSLKFPSERIP